MRRRDPAEPAAAVRLARARAGWTVHDCAAVLQRLGKLLGGGAKGAGLAQAALRDLARQSEEAPALAAWAAALTDDELLARPEVTDALARAAAATGGEGQRADLRPTTVATRQQALDSHPEGERARQAARLTIGSPNPAAAQVDLEALLILRDWQDAAS